MGGFGGLSAGAKPWEQVGQDTPDPRPAGVTVNLQGLWLSPTASLRCKCLALQEGKGRT
jgi:hypothetical protein